MAPRAGPSAARPQGGGLPQPPGAERFPPAARPLPPPRCSRARPRPPRAVPLPRPLPPPQRSGPKMAAVSVSGFAAVRPVPLGSRLSQASVSSADRTTAAWVPGAGELGDGRLASSAAGERGRAAGRSRLAACSGPAAALRQAPARPPAPLGPAGPTLRGGGGRGADVAGGAGRGAAG